MLDFLHLSELLHVERHRGDRLPKPPTVVWVWVGESHVAIDTTGALPVAVKRGGKAAQRRRERTH